MGCHVCRWGSRGGIFSALSPSSFLFLLPPARPITRSKSSPALTGRATRTSQPSPSLWGHLFPATAGPQPTPLPPQPRGGFWCSPLPPPCEFSSQRPPRKVGHTAPCVSPRTAHDSAAVRVSYLGGLCQKPQAFLSQEQQKELGVSTQKADNVCSRFSCKLAVLHCQEAG